MTKTSLNLDENIESMLCYIGIWITGLVFLFAEKENKTVKFHAKQSLFFFLPLNILGILFWWIGSPKWSYGGGWHGLGHFDPGIPALVWISWIIWIIMLIFFVIFIITAYQGQKFKVPIIGDLAEK